MKYSKTINELRIINEVSWNLTFSLACTDTGIGWKNQSGHECVKQFQ